jgi:hypothetical protein
MMRSRTGRRILLAVVSWTLCASVVQEGFGDDVGRAARPLQEKLELRVRERNSPPPERQHERTYDDSIEPWELVSV